MKTARKLNKKAIILRRRLLALTGLFLLSATISAIACTVTRTQAQETPANDSGEIYLQTATCVDKHLFQDSRGHLWVYHHDVSVGEKVWMYMNDNSTEKIIEDDVVLYIQ